MRLRAALCADDPWTALYVLNTDQPGRLAKAVEERDAGPPVSSLRYTLPRPAGFPP